MENIARSAVTTAKLNAFRDRFFSALSRVFIPRHDVARNYGLLRREIPDR